MSPHARLVNRIGEAFETGALPHAHPKDIWRSYGVGDACTACGDPIPRGHDVVEFDIDGHTYRLHSDCYGLWQGELIRRGTFKPE
jgi:hypothetical protein